MLKTNYNYVYGFLCTLYDFIDMINTCIIYLCIENWCSFFSCAKAINFNLVASVHIVMVPPLCTCHGLARSEIAQCEIVVYLDRLIFIGGDNFRCWMLVSRVSGTPRQIQSPPFYTTSCGIAQSMADVNQFSLIYCYVFGETFCMPHSKRLLDY